MFGGAFLIPGIGQILMAGPLVAAIVSTIEGAAIVGGLSALGAALISLGIPKNSALAYETQIGVGKYVLIVHGSAEDIARA